MGYVIDLHLCTATATSKRAGTSAVFTVLLLKKLFKTATSNCFEEKKVQEAKDAYTPDSRRASVCLKGNFQCYDLLTAQTHSEPSGILQCLAWKTSKKYIFVGLLSKVYAVIILI
ncbi:hypothetical protein AMECASPLE_024136 [Ameca splendens]|uniref:Uncharacterized protein n=1 Tax=Ameca splendens TaxID=208324 RepID=A0ABV0Z294_9TELE